MKLNKSPGADGLTSESDIHFWDVIKHMVINALNESYEVGELSNSQKDGLITLIYKKNDKDHLQNGRPITLLNIDFKIAAYALATRLKKIMPKMINTDQNEYFKNRFIGYNIRQIQDIIDYSEKFKIDSAVLFLDFSKAFYTQEWDFMIL